MKLPKLFAKNVPLGIVRSSGREYVTKEGIFQPETHRDFYFFIRQGFLLADDPDVKFEKQANLSVGTTDDDVMRDALARRGNKVIDTSGDEQAFKDECYKIFFEETHKAVEAGKMAGYPTNMNERAEEFYQKELKKRNKKEKLEKEKPEEETKEDVTIPEETQEELEQEALEVKEGEGKTHEIEAESETSVEDIT